MGNITDDIRRHFDTFAALPFTEADSLALSQLAYARMPDNVPRYHEDSADASGMIPAVSIRDLLRAECYDCLCSISCCGFSHDDFSGLGRACRPRNGLNWMVLVSPPERTGKDYDQHAPSTVYPSFAAERGIRRVDRAENTCQRADGA